MLNNKELQEIKKLVANNKKGKNKITVDNLLELLESQYTKNNPLLDTFTKPDKKTCINPTRTVQPPETEQSKFEKKNMVKIRTANDSMVADETRNAPKVGQE